MSEAPQVSALCNKPVKVSCCFLPSALLPIFMTLAKVKHETNGHVPLACKKDLQRQVDRVVLAWANS